jgi:hypothetical protein
MASSNKFLRKAEGRIRNYPIDGVCFIGIGQKISHRRVSIMESIGASNFPEIFL